MDIRQALEDLLTSLISIFSGFIAILLVLILHPVGGPRDLAQQRVTVGRLDNWGRSSSYSPYHAYLLCFSLVAFRV